MRLPALDRAAGGNQRLADHLAAEHALPAGLRAGTAEQVHLQRLEVEDVENGLGRGHAGRDRWLELGDRSSVDAVVAGFRRHVIRRFPVPGTEPCYTEAAGNRRLL